MTVKVVCPHVTISPETFAALNRSGYAWEPADVSGSEAAYWGLLAGLWSAGEAFAIVEHDIVPSAEALGSLASCGGDWCACAYPYVNGLYAGLGCARFSAAITGRHPDLMDVVAGMSDATHPPRHWCRLDGWMRSVLMQRGEGQCTAHPEAGHPSRAPSHGCVPGLPRR